jgi:hypothetical protein
MVLEQGSWEEKMVSSVIWGASVCFRDLGLIFFYPPPRLHYTAFQVAKCRSRLAIRSESGRAVLFYSQLPNGEEDKASTHGGCPVLSGQKWAANLWVWSTPRQGYPGNPKNPRFKHTSKSRKASEVNGETTADGMAWKKVSAIFGNQGADPRFENAELFFENSFWGKMGSSDPPFAVDTYKGHVWNVRVDGKVVHTWTITSDEEDKQGFYV